MGVTSQSSRSGHRHAIVAGFGPVGRAVSNSLEASGFAVTVVEINPSTAERQLELGRAVVLGDATEPVTLQEAGIERADALVLTMPNERQVLTACELARRLSPTIFISARTNHMSMGMLATQAGADHVTVQEVVTAQAMQAAVTDGLGEPAEAPHTPPDAIARSRR